MDAIRTLFRTLQLYGATLSLNTWDECIWKVMFPLLDTLLPHRRRNALTAPSLPDTATHTDNDTLASDSSSSSSWDESKVVRYNRSARL
jgi:Leucine-rich repeat (LRR) protein